MRPGRLPEDHPEEQEARARLRALSPKALAKIQQQTGQSQQSVQAPRQPSADQPRRWGA